jgi:SAM-dependent methyltransferase
MEELQPVKYLVCNVCEGALIPRFDNVRDPITNESFSILSCKRCGLGHTIPQPADLSRYYGQPYYGQRHGLTSKFCTKRRMNLLNQTAVKESKKRLLDVGCGDGSFLLAAKQAGWRVMGTELNPEPARDFGLDVSQTLYDINPSERFDRVTMWHSLEHMRDIKTTLFLIERLLAPKGHLIIAVPNSRSLQAKLFGHRWLHFDAPRHLYHFDPASLRFSLDNAGFCVYSVRHNEIEYDLIGWSQTAMNYLNFKPNMFLGFLTAKGNDYPVWVKVSTLIIGSILTLAFVAALPVESFLSRSGTFVMVAAKKTIDQPTRP